MLDRTLKEMLRNAAAEFEFQQTKKFDHIVAGSLDGYLGAIDEMEELMENGESAVEAFNGTFDGSLRKSLLPVMKKYGGLK
jgi:hypothetical protein